MFKYDEEHENMKITTIIFRIIVSIVDMGICVMSFIAMFSGILDAIDSGSIYYIVFSIILFFWIMFFMGYLGYLGASEFIKCIKRLFF